MGNLITYLSDKQIDTCIAVLMTSQKNYDPVKILKFKKQVDEKRHQQSFILESKEIISLAYEEKLLHSYLISEDLILLAMSRSIFMYNGSLNLIKETKFDSLNSNIVSATCLHRGLQDHYPRFITSFEVDKKLDETKQKTFDGENRPGFNSLLIAGNLDEAKQSFVFRD